MRALELRYIKNIQSVQHNVRRDKMNLTIVLVRGVEAANSLPTLHYNAESYNIWWSSTSWGWYGKLL